MRVIISAGGTGGHIYPALAIIKKLQEKEKHVELIYIGTHNRMEKDLIPKHGINYIPIEIYGFSRTNIKRDIRNVLLINRSIKKCMNIMKEFKPDVVIGVGGYVSYPVIKAAHKLSIKTIIHEQNIHPGKANKMLSRFADKICVSFEETMKYFNKDKVLLTGNPCSERAKDIKKVKKSEFGFHDTKKLVLIVMGSLGSESINDLMKDYLSNIQTENYEVLYITGKYYYEDFMYKSNFSPNVTVVPYVDDLIKIMGSADLMITRSGATVISEIIELTVPSIFIPSRYVANNEQILNAMELKKNNAGEIILESELSIDNLKSNINTLLNDKVKYLDMKNRLKEMQFSDSSTKIYNIIKDLMK